MSSFNPVHKIGDQIVEAIQAHHDIDKAAAAPQGRRGTRLGRHPGSPRRGHGHYPFEFSGGMRQRAMIAMALALRARDPDRRRADHGARRHDPGADHRTAQGPEPGARAVGDPDHPRPRRGGRGRGSRAWSCTPARSSSRARSTRSSMTLSTPTPGACSARSRGSTRSEPNGCRRSAGQPPSLLALPQGCRFAPRCPHAFEKCSELPPLEERLPRAKGHADRCWLEPADKKTLREVGRPDRTGGAGLMAKGDPILEVEHLVKHFPIKSGIFFDREVGQRQGRRRRQPHPPRG